jgi:branched-chain amino acid aminotransferase
MMDYTKYVGYMNGEWMPSSELKIDVRDRGFRVGDTVFDVSRTFNGTTFKLKEHVERLYRSLKYVRIDAGMSVDDMVELTEEAVRRNLHMLDVAGDFEVWQMVTRGFNKPAKQGPPTVIIEICPNPWDWATRFYQTGAPAVITKTRSYSSDALDPKIKHHSRMNFNLAEVEAADMDPDAWPIMTDAQGNLTEGVGNNVFIVTNGVVKTPGDSSILQGVSRATVIDFARQLGMEVSEEALQPYDLYTADEAFFCSTPFCVVPVVNVDKRQIGDGKPGPVSQQILAAWSEKVGLDIVDQAERFLPLMG